jgi:hypothetical protein
MPAIPTGCRLQVLRYPDALSGQKCPLQMLKELWLEFCQGGVSRTRASHNYPTIKLISCSVERSRHRVDFILAIGRHFILRLDSLQREECQVGVD